MFAVGQEGILRSIANREQNPILPRILPIFRCSMIY
jgi:hypothetical protein